MRTFTIGAAALIAVSWSTTAIADQKRKRAVEPRHTRTLPLPRKPYDDRDRWYPNDANQLRIGSQIWWDQMAREGRLGKPSP